MTTKETAEALGVSESTIQRHAKELGLTENGKPTELDEKSVTIIKTRIERSGRNDLRNVAELPNVSTDLEMMILDARVSEWKTRRIEELQKQLSIATPKVESFDALMRSENTMSITSAAKHFGVHPKTQVFPYLRELGYLTSKDLPTQAALDAGYLAVREVKGNDGVMRPQAVVLACQLETWRTKVIPQIAKWEATE